MKPDLSRTLFLSLLVLRFACTILPGYVHPDEFFQGGQELYFGCNPTATTSNGSASWGFSPPLTTTWEFESQNAIRSIVPPTVMTAVPLRAYVSACRWLHRLARIEPGPYRANSTEEERWEDYLTGFEIWIVPRLFLALLSILTIDLSVIRMLEAKRRRKERGRIKKAGGDDGGKGGGNASPTVASELLVLSSSWTSLLFVNRPFSNTLETMCLACLLAIISIGFESPPCSRKKQGAISAVAVGIVCSIGIFVRFTFGFFAFPAVVIFLHKRGIQCLRNRATAAGYEWGIYLGYALQTIAFAALGFIFTSCAFIYADTQFYSAHQKHATLPDEPRPTIWGFYITPLNALLYNFKIGNLGDHGLHPRITHLLVNMPMLFGPLAIMFYGDILKKPWEIARETRLLGANGISALKHDSCGTDTLCRLVILSGLGILSCAPHQEPRFLLPLLVPLVVVYGDGIGLARRYSKPWRWIPVVFWIVFNLLLLLFFGTLHQSGVVPSLLQAGVSEHSSTKGGQVLIYYHTYMPPTFLTRSRTLVPEQAAAHYSVCGENSEGGITGVHSEGGVTGVQENMFCSAVGMGTRASFTCGSCRIHDLKGADIDTLQETLRKYMTCDHGVIQEKNGTETDLDLFIVAPASVIERETTTCGGGSPCLLRDYSFQRKSAYRPHISTEDMPIWTGCWRRFLEDMELSIHQVKCSK